MRLIIFFYLTSVSIASSPLSLQFHSCIPVVVIFHLSRAGSLLAWWSHWPLEISVYYKLTSNSLNEILFLWLPNGDKSTFYDFKYKALISVAFPLASHSQGSVFTHTESQMLNLTPSFTWHHSAKTQSLYTCASLWSLPLDFFISSPSFKLPLFQIVWILSFISLSQHHHRKRTLSRALNLGVVVCIV